MNPRFLWQPCDKLQNQCFWIPGRFESVLKMLEFFAFDFVKTVNTVNAMVTLCEKAKRKNGIESALLLFRKELMELHAILLGIECANSALRVKRLLDNLERPPCFGNYTAWKADINEVIQTIEDDLQIKTIYVVPYSKADFLNHCAKMFTDTVREYFSSIELDIKEACLCFALNRHTASVFHLMRILEVGLYAMGESLGLAVHTNWHNALDQIEKEIKRRNIDPTDDWKVDRAFYEEASTHFRMIKGPWRNYTMHGNSHYDEPQARDIFASVAPFMSHIAKRLSEKAERESS